jgi:hypothetical protein
MPTVREKGGKGSFRIVFAAAGVPGRKKGRKEGLMEGMKDGRNKGRKR